MREKELLKKLQGNPSIVGLHKTFMDEEHLYFVFEHCKYGTLSNLISILGTLSPEQAKFYAAEIVVGLEACFSHKIMHRDLKPENLMIDERRHLKLVSESPARVTPHSADRLR